MLRKHRRRAKRNPSRRGAAGHSRGMFAGEVGSLRLRKLFDRWGIKTTWFIPGHSIETFPKQMTQVAKAGHGLNECRMFFGNRLVEAFGDRPQVVGRSVAFRENRQFVSTDGKNHLKTLKRAMYGRAGIDLAQIIFQSDNGGGRRAGRPRGATLLNDCLSFPLQVSQWAVVFAQWRRLADRPQLSAPFCPHAHDKTRIRPGHR